MKVGKHYVRLDDGTCWAFDQGDDDHDSLEWVLRYGSTEQREAQRLTVASVIASYMALLYKPQKRRNQIVWDIRAALDSLETGKP